ncbi:PREDICTED: atherin-like, partial [Chinchilla lanigera]|uniref:atherin-like n=1 Tax=Chinchilla lanigera TaxID=34839 RepID=UPI0006987190
SPGRARAGARAAAGRDGARSRPPSPAGGPPPFWARRRAHLGFPPFPLCVPSARKLAEAAGVRGGRGSREGARAGRGSGRGRAAARSRWKWRLAAGPPAAASPAPQPRRGCPAGRGRAASDADSRGERPEPGRKPMAAEAPGARPRTKEAGAPFVVPPPAGGLSAGPGCAREGSARALGSRGG